MVARNSRAILKALQKKGFRLNRGHHLKLMLYVNDKYFGIHTFLSHGSRDYGDPLLASMSKQLHLSKQELLSFIDCSMSGADYLDLMHERGHIA